MLNRYIGKNATSWEAELKAAWDEVQRHGHEMSEYERNVIMREIKQRQEELTPIVGGQAVAEFREAIGAFQAAEKKIADERRKEINRFDTAKYNAELQAIQARVKMTVEHPKNIMDATEKPISQRLQQIYDEAIQSGDIHKQRAAVEVIKDMPVVGSQPEERMSVNFLAKTAAAKEAEVRQTDGILKAQQERQAALQELDQRRERLNTVSQALGMGRADDLMGFSFLARAYKQVQRDPATGEIKIYQETDPEVTGVYWKGEKTA